MNLLNKLFKQEEEEQKPEQQVEKPVEKPMTKEDEINAAIAAGIFSYFIDMHDYEDLKMTIKRVNRPYVPWASKNHFMRTWPRK